MSMVTSLVAPSAPAPVPVDMDAQFTDLLAAPRSACDQLILSLTSACTMRCKYCVYSGGYDNQREHSATDDPDAYQKQPVGMQALDLFFGNAADVDTLSIGFYDESLMNMDALRAIVTEARSRQGDKTLRFMVTTNGQLLKDDVCDFLMAQDFEIYVSIDGPKEIHDAWRVGANGKGTWDKIMERLAALQARAPDYYRDKVVFQVTVAHGSYLMPVNAFYATHPLVKGNRLVARPVKNTDIKDVDGMALPEPVPLAQTAAFAYLGDCVGQGALDRVRFLLAYWGSGLRKIHQREDNAAPLRERLCVPGQRKMYVNVQGDVHVCEKAGSALKIGHVGQGGVDGDRVDMILARYMAAAKSQCGDCPVVDLCSVCFDVVSNDGLPDTDRLLAHCAAEKARWAEMEELYAYLREQGPGQLARALETPEAMTDPRCGF